ncbi:3642_t:CDS:2, partial [Paraglomus occultum]
MHLLQKAIMITCLATSVLSLPNSHNTGKRSSGEKKIEHVVLLSFDGLHQSDVDAYVKANPSSAIATLLKTSVEFDNAQTSKPSDSFPGLIAQVTGGSPKTTGVFYDVSYDRTFFDPGSNCTGTPGAVTAYDETIDFNSTALVTSINPANLPKTLKNGQCVEVTPHEFLKVNTIFEVAKKNGFFTAWTDKHPAYDIVNGPSGQGVDDLYTPEINGINTVEPDIQVYDTLHLNAILNWLKGVSSTGKSIPVPGILGGNFQVISVSEKDSAGGYLDTVGQQPSDELKKALDFCLNYT